MELIYSGLSEIFQTNLTFHFGLDVEKHYGLSFGDSQGGRRLLNSFVTPVSFFILSVVFIFYCCSCDVAELDFVFENTFYGSFEPTDQMGGVYDALHGRIRAIPDDYTHCVKN